MESVFLKGIAFPLCERMNDFRVVIIVFHFKADRPFNAVQIVVQTGERINKDRGGYTKKIQFCGKSLLKKVFDCFNGDLSLMKIQIGLISHRGDKAFHLFFLHNYNPRGQL